MIKDHFVKVLTFDNPKSESNDGWVIYDTDCLSARILRYMPYNAHDFVRSHILTRKQDKLNKASSWLHGE